MLKETKWDIQDETNTMWDKLDECVKRKTKGILGESREKCPFCKDTWWWNEVFKIQWKQNELLIKFGKIVEMRNFLKDINMREKKKIIIWDAKYNAYDDLYDKLGTKVGERYIFKLSSWVR